MHIFSSRLPKKSGFKLGVAEYGAQTNQPNKPVAQLCPTLGDPMDWSLPGSSAHGIFQAGVLEWAAIAFSVNCVAEAYFPCVLEETGLWH